MRRAARRGPTPRSARRARRGRCTASRLGRHALLDPVGAGRQDLHDREAAQIRQRLEHGGHRPRPAGHEEVDGLEVDLLVEPATTSTPSGARAAWRTRPATAATITLSIFALIVFSCL